MQAFINAKLITNIEQYIKDIMQDIDQGKSIDKQVFQFVLELNICKVLPLLKTVIKKPFQIQQLTECSYTQKFISYYLSFEKQLPALPSNPTFNQRLIFKFLYGENIDAIKDDKAQENCNKILQSNDPQLVAALLFKSFGDLKLSLKTENVVMQPKEPKNSPITQVININDLLHNNCVVLNEISNISIDYVRAVDVLKHIPNSLKLLTNIQFLSKITYEQIEPDEDIADILENQITQSINQNFDALISKQRPKLLNNQLYYLAHQFCQTETQLNYSEIQKQLEKVIKLLQETSEEFKVNAALLFATITNIQSFVYNNSTYIPNVTIVDRLPQVIARLKKVLLDKINLSKDTLSFNLLIQPPASLCYLLLHNFPLINISFVLMNRALNDGPKFCIQLLELLSLKVDQFPLEFHYFTFELLQKSPWLYIDESPIFKQSKDELHKAIQQFVVAVYQQTGVALVMIKQNWTDNNLYKKQVDDMMILLTQYTIDTEKLVDLVFSGYTGSYYFEKPQKDDEESSLDVKDKKISVDNNYLPTDIKEARSMVKVSFCQSQDQTQIAFINRFLQECLTRISDKAYSQEIRVRLFQVIILSMKKYRVLLSNAINVFGNCFQSEASLSFQLIVSLFQAIFTYNQTDMATLQLQTQQVMAMNNSKQQIETQIRQLNQQSSSQLTTQQRELIQNYTMEMEKLKNFVNYGKQQLQYISEENSRLYNGLSQAPDNKKQEYTAQMNMNRNKIEQIKQQIATHETTIMNYDQQCTRIGGSSYQGQRQISILQKNYTQISSDITNAQLIIQRAKSFSTIFINLVKQELLNLDILSNKKYITETIHQFLQMPVPTYNPLKLQQELKSCIKCCKMNSLQFDELTMNLNRVTKQNAFQVLWCPSQL
ncbi:Conserved_hypothetical protein [Hexamita inflata]|uniref:Uncharacterized protein n=1 Tax=Hexamita inflata TaxID=28002 RepID=A0AA86UIR9_9EUKA|nr:Conserved hypothetical protein [Hexamita inflata]